MNVTPDRRAHGQRARRRDIQGMRGLAVLLVVAGHAGLGVPGGFVGVDVFFVISGFVICATLSDELSGTGRIDLGAFYARRIRRLLPALALLIAVVAPLSAIAGPIATQRIGALTGAAASLFVANGYLYHQTAGYFGAEASLNPFLHTWTLAVEEQFYLVFPILLFSAWWLGRRWSAAAARMLAIASLVVVSGGSLVLCIALSDGRRVSGLSSSAQFSFFSSPTRAWEFGFGAVIALVAPSLRRFEGAAASVMGWIGLAAIAYAAFAFTSSMRYPGAFALVPVLGAGALLVAGTGGAGFVSRVLATRPAVSVGDLSYSIYLWHWPSIVFARALLPGNGWAAPVAAGISFVPAWVSYRYVESPVRFGRRFRGWRVLRLVALCIAVPIGVSLLTERAVDSSAWFERWQLSQAPHADVATGCDSETPFGNRGVACTWAVGAPRGEVVLIGDSNAGQFAEPVIRAANLANYNAVVATYSGCPFAGVAVVGGGSAGGDGSCRRFDIESLHALLSTRPSLVIVANRDDAYVSGTADGLSLLDATTVTHEPRQKLIFWREGLTSIFGQLNRAGIPVVVVHTIPDLPTLAGCAAIRVAEAGCSSQRVLRHAVEAALGPIIAADNGAASSVPATTTVDFSDTMCSRQTCRSSRDGLILYRDSDHLSVQGALTLTPRFRAAIETRARPSSQ